MIEDFAQHDLLRRHLLDIGDLRGDRADIALVGVPVDLPGRAGDGAVGLRRAAPIAGIVGISGLLVAPESLRQEIRSRPPVLLIHGTEDEVVPFRSMDLAAAALSDVGVAVETQVSPGVGHSVGQDGLAAATAFARRVLS